MKDGFTLTDPPVTKLANRKLEQMLRSDFDKLGARERATKMKEGSRSSTERPSRYYIGRRRAAKRR
jgi:hypothetical protein